jgi:hypothetical protein
MKRTFWNSALVSRAAIMVRVDCRVTNNKRYIYFEELLQGIRIGGEDSYVEGMVRRIINMYRQEHAIPPIPEM